MRQDWVDEGVIAVEEIERRAIGLNRVRDETDRLLEHGVAQIVAEIREALAIDAVELLKSADIEPVAAKLDRQAPDFPVGHHALRLSQQNIRPMQLALGGTGYQPIIRHARPEEITEPTGELII